MVLVCSFFRLALMRRANPLYLMFEDCATGAVEDSTASLTYHVSPKRAVLLVVLAGIPIGLAKMRHEAASRAWLQACFLPDRVPLLLVELQAGHHEGCKFLGMLIAFFCLALQCAGWYLLLCLPHLLLVQLDFFAQCMHPLCGPGA